MFQLLFKNSIRHLKRNKLFTFLNILGLTIGISSCWVIFKYVSYELSYEKANPNHENIYRVISHFKFDDKEDAWNGGMSRPVFFALKEDVSSLERVVPYFQFYTESVIIPEGNGQPKRVEELDFESKVMETEESYFEMVPYTWLAGNKVGALSNPNQVVLTEERAKLYFPNLKSSEIIGKTLIYSDTLQKTVTGIVANLDYPSEFSGKEFFQLQKTESDNQLGSWTNTNGSDKIYIQAESQGKLKSALTQIINITNRKYDEFKKERKPQFSYNRIIDFLPLRDSHFSTFMKEYGMDKTSKSVIYGIIGVSIFLLLLACINYINLTTAQIPQRSKEIGIRKTLGSSQKSLVAQMMMETLIIISASIFVSYFVSKLGYFLIGDLISQNAIAYNNPIVFGTFIFVVLMFTVFIAGLYPSWLITKVNAIDIFRSKGNVRTSNGNFNLRKALIVFQFIIAQVFIVAAIIIGQQLQFTVKKDLGFKKDAVLLADIPYKYFDSENFASKKKTLAVELEKLKGVEEVSIGNRPLADGYSSSPFRYMSNEADEPISQILFKKEVDSKYLKFYGIKLLAGQNLSNSDTTNGYIINESALLGFGFKTPQEAVGKLIEQNNSKFPIVGVVQDFHTRDFYNVMEPLAMMTGPYSGTFNIRLNEANYKEWPSIIANLKAKWLEFFPADNIEFKFYDESILALYKKEDQLQKITNISTGIAILLSCLGLFGLATITAFQRTKEIGIRKVLGASITGIVGLLSKDFVKMVLIAILIASPIVWWACNKWLEDFIYRIEISWFPFVFGGMIAIVAAMLTVSYQAIKAAKVNPVESLRDE